MRNKMLYSMIILIIFVLLLMGCDGSHHNENESVKFSVAIATESQNVETNFSTYTIDDTINNKQTKLADEYNVSENGEIWNFLDTLNHIVYDEKYYKVYSNTDYTSYYYQIFDDKSTMLDYGYYGWRGAKFEQNGDILCLRLLYGGNIGNEKYYDIKNSKVSKIFECVLDQENSMIAYFSVSQDDQKQPVIIIEDIFDPCTYHYEFPINISDTSLLQHYTLDAEFIDNNSKFQITYLTAGDYKEVTETIELKKTEKTGDGSLS